ncbi:c-type cytochrome [Carboxylicivirga caseinilyticus]|uniref:c-type cytochrome n=1 Tax=Carboxylicivirga caseinilyticus TaxID=3417572 RepID=UPI003D33B85C|nr:c-type cytochrome [Marinilabiliaceae bacterium A049]
MEENLKDQKMPEVDPLTNDKFVPEHEFDGIRELANNPPWWLTFIFIFSILFAYVYLAKYHFFSDGKVGLNEYEAELYAVQMQEEAAAGVEAVAAEGGGGISIETVKVDYSVPLTAQTDIDKGAKVFATNCAVCHLAEGQGLVGPNLTDEYWIHGGSFENIMTVINNGVIEKGMIAWKGQISDAQIHQVASFITTLQGTNPPNPKAPQGEKYVPAAE